MKKQGKCLKMTQTLYVCTHRELSANYLNSQVQRAEFLRDLAKLTNLFTSPWGSLIPILQTGRDVTQLCPQGMGDQGADSAGWMSALQT